MRKAFIILTGILLFLKASGKENRLLHRAVSGVTDSTDIFYRQWQRVAQMMADQRPISASKLVDSLYIKAKDRNEPVVMLKAQLFFLAIVSDTGENPKKEVIKFVESKIKESVFPYKAIWQNIAAQLYRKYYEDEMYNTILNRKPIVGEAPTDFEEWDARLFNDKIARLYSQFIVRNEDLEKIDIRKFSSVLLGDTGTNQYRPTLFDLLAFRSLDFFEKDEREMLKPAFPFVMDDEAAFAPTAEFARHRFSSTDTGSPNWKALKLYRQLLRFHLADKDPGPMLDADLHRLRFVYDHSILPEKKRLYRTALLHIAEEYPDNELGALASVRVMQLDFNIDEQSYYDYSRFREYDPGNKTDFLPVLLSLHHIAEKFPGSEASEQAQAMYNYINKHELSFETEKVILPDEPSKILVSYRNITNAKLWIIKLAGKEYVENADTNYIRQAVLKYTISLPWTGDYCFHSAEIKIDPLKPGAYCMYLCTGDSIIVMKQRFQVSGLAVVKDRNPGRSSYVLDRKSGAPVGSAKVIYSLKGREGKTVAETAPDGSFRMAVNKEFNSGVLDVCKQSDTLYGDYYYYNASRSKSAIKRTFFFTDRAIYRPGQVILFKGIIVASSFNSSKANVLRGEKTEVVLKDDNGDKVQSMNLKTNEFGSVTGSFTIPEGLLPGSLTIENESGQTAISVEEYKRPKFRVFFDAHKKPAALNEKVQMSGNAVTFAGNAVDGATVKYHVTRSAWPKGWGHSPGTAPFEISHGTTNTDAQGKFAISFMALADATADLKDHPVYDFEVAVDITDLNGETHSASTSFSVGYISERIEANIPAFAAPSQLTSLNVTTRTLNGDFLPGKVDIKISKFRDPDHYYRERPWAAPDQFVMDEQEFHKNFPLDAYKDEGDFKTRPLIGVVYHDSAITSEQATVSIPIASWKQNGWYQVELKTLDKSGQILAEKRYVEVYDKDNSGIINEPLLAIPGKQELLPGDTLTVQVASGLGPCTILGQEKTSDGKGVTVKLSYKDGPLQLQRKITETDRGGMELYYVLFKENRLYTVDQTIAVPWTNKDLRLEWATHRDKLLPGTKEKWTVTIKGNKKEKVAAEMLAAMYDASLDAFMTNTFDFEGLRPTVIPDLGWSVDLGVVHSLPTTEGYNLQVLPEKTHYRDLIIAGSEPNEEFGLYTYEWEEKEDATLEVTGGKVPPPPPPGKGTRMVIVCNLVSKTGDPNGIDPGIVRAAKAPLREIESIPTTEVTDLVSLAPGVYNSGRGCPMSCPFEKTFQKQPFFIHSSARTIPGT